MSDYGPKVQWAQLTEGTRIYYTGDMANQSGLGTITKAWFDAKWGYHLVDIAMDDEREWKAIHLASFQPGPGRRFWLLSDWEAKRQAQINTYLEWARRRQTA